MGFSARHASTVPLTLNPATGAVSPQWNVVFDDQFSTVSSTSTSLPDFNSDEWHHMFQDSTFQFPFDDEDWAAMEHDEQAQIKADAQHERTAQRFDHQMPSTPLSMQPLLYPQVKLEIPNVAPPSSLSSSQQRETIQETTTFVPPVQQREQFNRGSQFRHLP
jgi:hypothetical protein